jgi:hypothetical protein
MIGEQAAGKDALGATVFRRAGLNEGAEGHGRYWFVCHDAEGNEKWRDTIDNITCNEGKNVMLDSSLAGSGYTAACFMGLISNVGWSAVAATDTAAQINGTNAWKEAGGANAPTYSGFRPTCLWSVAAAGVKSLSAALAFNITSGSNLTVKGGFIVFGAGATHTIDDPHGFLLSVGTFTNGDKIVSNGDTISATYSYTLT